MRSGRSGEKWQEGGRREREMQFHHLWLEVGFRRGTYQHCHDPFTLVLYAIVSVLLVYVVNTPEDTG